MDGCDRPCAATQEKSDGVRLDFVDVTFEVPLKGSWTEGRDRGVKKKRILDGVSGYMLPGEVLYIMGPSGVGKSVLLDCLAGRTLIQPGGKQWLNGTQKTEKDFRRVAQYCTQEVVLYESLTVRETMFYAASFYTKKERDRQQRTNEALCLLNLEEQADVRIGGVFFRGISGGQKKRVAVGETSNHPLLSMAKAMMAEPRILLLDEPTSNLDSSAAFHLVTRLKAVALLKNTTIAATIHQPSERVFEVSDRLMLLGSRSSGSKVAYFGRSKKALDYFSSLGESKPSLTSAAEWMMDLIDEEFNGLQGANAIIDAWELSELCSRMSSEQRKGDEHCHMRMAPKQSIGLVGQVALLVRRFFWVAVSNPTVIWLRYGMYIALALAMGPVWWQIGNDATISDVSGITGGIFAAAGFFSLMSISVIPSLLDDKSVMLKERANGNYCIFSFCFANILVSTPLLFLLSTSCTCIFYWIAGLNQEASRFFFFILNLFLTLVVSESVCVLISAMLDSFVLCTAVTAFVFGTYMSVSGFLVKYENIPVPWNLLHYVSFHSYAFASFVINEFDGETIKGDPNSPLGLTFDVPGEIVISEFGYANDSKWMNVGILIAMAVAYRILASIWLQFCVRAKK